MRVWSFAVPACALAVLVLSHHGCQAQGASAETRTEADYDQTSAAGPHHRIVPVRGARSADAGAAGSGSIVEIGGGLNDFEEGQWKPSRAEFVPVEGGVHAVTGQHKVRLASSLLTPGCVAGLEFLKGRVFNKEKDCGTPFERVGWEALCAREG